MPCFKSKSETHRFMVLPLAARGKPLAHRGWHGRVVRDAGAHLPAAGVVVGDGPVHGAADHRVAAAVGALEHPVGVGAAGLDAAAYSGHGEGEAREAQAVDDGSDDGLLGLCVRKSLAGIDDWLPTGAFILAIV